MSTNQAKQEQTELSSVQKDLISDQAQSEWLQVTDEYEAVETHPSQNLNPNGLADRPSKEPVLDETLEQAVKVSPEKSADEHNLSALSKLPSLPCDLDRYRLTQLRGEGGTARIYRAFETHSKQPIAIKLLRRRLQSDQVIHTLFKRYGKALAQFQLPHVNQVIDSGDSIWGPWWALSWLEGETLKETIEKGVNWEGKRLLALMIQLCEALAALHEKAIIHGDLTPENVMYHQEHRQEQAQLTLIDLALPFRAYQEQAQTRSEQDQTNKQSSITFGQPKYMAPECLQGEAPSVASDLYGLGLIFFEMSTGTPAFNRPLNQVLHDILEGETPSAARRQSPWPYPPALDALISNLLSKKPKNRISTASEVKIQLQGILQVLNNQVDYSKTEEFSSQLLSKVRDEVQDELPNSQNSQPLSYPAIDYQPTLESARYTDVNQARITQDLEPKKRVQISDILWGCLGIIVSLALLRFLSFLL